MTTTSTPLVASGRSFDAGTAPSSRTLWRWAGGLALAHLVVMLGAFALEGLAAENGNSASSVARSYADASLGRMLGAGYVEAFSFVLLVPALVLLARLFGRRTDVARAATQTFLALGIAYVAATLAVGFPPGAAAAYAAHHGVDASVVATVNDVRNYGFMLQVMLLAAMTAALGIAALLDRVMVRWVGWAGVVVGVAGVCLVPFAHNAVSLVWMIWWAGLAVLCLRGGPSPRNS